MKNLLEKIKIILHDRRTRRLLTRLVAGIAAVVVFVTTYALVLPAITMEREAHCGIEAHQHDESCYEERLVCGLTESEQHQHDESCYEKVLVCGKEAHIHSAACYVESTAETESSEDTTETDSTETVSADDDLEAVSTDGGLSEELVSTDSGAGEETVSTDGGSGEESVSSGSGTTEESATSDAGSTDGSATTDLESSEESSSSGSGTTEVSAASGAGSTDGSALTDVGPTDSTVLPDAGLTDSSESSDSGLTDAATPDTAEENAAAMLTGEEAAAVTVAYPAVYFENSLVVSSGALATDTRLNTGMDAVENDTEFIVHVEADEGTFPEGTTMWLSTVSDEQMDTVAEAVQGAVDGKTKGFHAIDISFRNADDIEIEPLKPIRVSMRSDSIRQAVEDNSAAPVVVHVEDADSPAISEDEQKTEAGADGNDADAEYVEAGAAADKDSSGTSVPEDGPDDNENSSENNENASDNSENASDNKENVSDNKENGSENIENSSDTKENSAENKADSSVSGSDSKSDESLSATIVEAATGDNATVFERDADGAGSSDGADTLTFESGSFSIYAIVYTVDFEYEVDGKTYNFSIPGGGFVSFEHLAEVLGLAYADGSSENASGEEDSSADEAAAAQDSADAESAGEENLYQEAIDLNNIEVSETTSCFVADVTSIEFSAPELLWVGKADTDTTIGALKNTNELEIQYSEELTEEQIAEIDTQKVKAGDWALISLLPFTSQETLAVTMADGETFTVNVTDAQAGGVTIHYVDRDGNQITGVSYTGTSQYVTANSDGTFYIPYTWSVTGSINLGSDFEKTGYTYASTHLAGTRQNVDYTYDGLTIDAALTEKNSSGNNLYLKTDAGSNVQYGNLVEYAVNSKITVPNENGNSTVNYSAANIGKDIYVILDPVPESSSSSSSTSADVKAPDFEKTLVSNKDGTYTLSLDVTAHGTNTSTNPKANVLFVVDTSSSMTKGVVSGNYTLQPSDNGHSRLGDTKAALKTLGEDLLAPNKTSDPDTVEVAVVTFDGGVEDELNWSTLYTDFEDTVDNNLDVHRGTDWEDGLDRAYELGRAKQESEPDQPLFVIFFTDGEPSQYRSFHGAGSASQNNVGYWYWYSYFLSRESAKDEARAIVNAGMQLYSIYAYNPDSGNYNGETGSGLLHNLMKYAYNTDDDLSQDHFFAKASSTQELNDAFAAILTKISQSIGTTNLIVNDGIATEVTSSTVVDGDVSGFTYIISDASGNLAYKVTVADGTPTFTMSDGTTTYTGIKKTIATTKIKTDSDGNPVTDSSGKIQTETVDVEVYYYKDTADGTEYIMPIATTGTNVTWDLSALGILKDGYKYQVQFVVWPNQDAYDLVAQLNNGIKDGITEDWDDLEWYTDSDGKKYQIGGISGHSYIARYEDGTYAAMSNTAQNIKYYKVSKTTVGGVETTTYSGPFSTSIDPPDPMELVDSTIKVKKEWDTGLDDLQRIRFLYNLDSDNKPVSSKEKTVTLNVVQDEETDNPYVTASVGWTEGSDLYDEELEESGGAYDWEAEKAISAGLMLSQTRVSKLRLNVSDTDKYKKITYNGTDYYVLETGHDYTLAEVATDYHFDFVADTYHPMVVDGTLKMVSFTTDSSGNITGIDSMSDEGTLTGTNVLRGRLRIQKVIKYADGEIVTPDPDVDISLKVSFTDAAKEAVKYSDYNPVDDSDRAYKVDRDGNYINEDGEIVDKVEEAVCVSYKNYPLWYYIYNKDGNLATHDGNALLFEDGETITFKSSEYIQIINIPLGFSYGFAELTDSLPAGMEFSQVMKQLSLSDSSHPPVYVVNLDELTEEMIAANQAETAIYSLDDGSHKMSGTPLSNNESQLTFTNVIEGYEIILRKVDAEMTTALGGVEFKLYKATVDEDTDVWTKGDQVGDTFTTAVKDADATDTTPAATKGKISLGVLEVGHYLLEETKAADGYNLPEKPIKITVGTKGVTYEQEGNSTSISGTGVEKDGFVYTISVTNTMGVELPATGGPGTRIFTILGSMLTAFAGAVILLKSIMKT